LTREHNPRDLLGNSIRTEAYGYGQDGGYYNASLTNSLVHYNLNNGAYSTRSNIVSVENNIRKKISETLQTRLKAWDIYNATARFYNSHE